MLLGIDPILPPLLLKNLAEMGHGDELTIADANFPASSTAQRLVELPGHGAPRVLRAVLSLMPLDQYVTSPAFSMQVVGNPDEQPEAVAAFQAEIDAVGGPPIEPLERFAFYDQARKSYAIIQTGETLLYGNIILKKGVIA